MDKVTQTNAAHAEETASASTQLSAQAVALDEAVAALVSLVGGEDTTRTATMARPTPPPAMTGRASTQDFMDVEPMHSSRN